MTCNAPWRVRWRKLSATCQSDCTFPSELPAENQVTFFDPKEIGISQFTAVSRFLFKDATSSIVKTNRGVSVGGHTVHRSTVPGAYIVAKWQN